LIARQRFMLNRTVRIAKRPADSEEPDAETVNGLADGETRLAQMTRELADAAAACSGEPCEPLLQAEDAMLASATSLRDQAFSNAVTQEKDALAYLIKARNTLRVVLGKSSQGATQAFRNFDRMQAQKLRKPKDEEEEKAQLASRLRHLADQEDIVYATLSGIKLADATAKPPSQQTPEAPSQNVSQQAKEPGETQTKPQPQEGSLDTESDQAESDPKDRDDEPNGPNRREIEDLQQEIVDEAFAVEQVMQRIDALTELARSRMARATEKAEQVSDALMQGDSEQAAKAAGEAEPMFRELAQHVEGLLAEEAAGRVAAARDLADKLAQRERELGDSLPDGPPPSPSSSSSSQDGQKGSPQESQPGQGGKPQSSSQNPADRSARLAQSGLTLEDLMKALAKLNEDGDSEATREIQTLLAEGELAQAVARMRDLEDVLRQADIQTAKAETEDIAEYLEALSLQLDTLQRSIVAPQLEELMALEKRASDLRERLDKLDSETAIDQWHRGSEALVRELTASRAGGDAGQDLLAAMRDAGWGDVSASGWRWRRLEGLYVTPGPYVPRVDGIVLELHRHIRELLLKDLVASDDEATPPEYRKLVDRYFQVLSEGERIE